MNDDRYTTKIIALPSPVATGFTYTSFELLMDGKDILNALKSVIVAGNEEFQYEAKIRFVRSDGEHVQDKKVQEQVKSVNVNHANLVAAGEYYDPQITWPTAVIADRNKCITRAFFSKLAKAKTEANVNLVATEDRADWIDAQCGEGGEPE
jgi:hypothetical protein